MPALYAFCNSWNHDRLWPKAFVHVDDDGQARVYGEVITDLERGVTPHQLDQLLDCGIVHRLRARRGGRSAARRGAGVTGREEHAAGVTGREAGARGPEAVDPALAAALAEARDLPDGGGPGARRWSRSPGGPTRPATSGPRWTPGSR